jgi:DNA-binding NtrC family response regulator
MKEDLAKLPNVSLVIVDDNAGSLELLSTALEQPGLDIWTANDPEEGLDLIFQSIRQSKRIWTSVRWIRCEVYRLADQAAGVSRLTC